jgi:hypothetical protein
MYCIKELCPLCYWGQIGFRLCSDKKTVVLMCDECDAVWLRPGDVNTSIPLYPQSPDFIVPGLECSILSPHSQWACKSDIIRVGWEQFIANDDKNTINPSLPPNPAST